MDTSILIDDIEDKLLYSHGDHDKLIVYKNILNEQTDFETKKILMKKAIEEFRNKEKFKNDTDFIKFWLSFGKLKGEDVFNEMEEAGVGTSSLCFWKTKCEILMKRGKKEEALRAFHIGQKRVRANVREEFDDKLGKLFENQMKRIVSIQPENEKENQPESDSSSVEFHLCEEPVVYRKKRSSEKRKRKRSPDVKFVDLTLGDPIEKPMPKKRKKQSKLKRRIRKKRKLEIEKPKVEKPKFTKERDQILVLSGSDSEDMNVYAEVEIPSSPDLMAPNIKRIRKNSSLDMLSSPESLQPKFALKKSPPKNQSKKKQIRLRKNSPIRIDMTPSPKRKKVDRGFERKAKIFTEACEKVNQAKSLIEESIRMFESIDKPKFTKFFGEVRQTLSKHLKQAQTSTLAKPVFGRQSKALRDIWRRKESEARDLALARKLENERQDLLQKQQQEKKEREERARQDARMAQQLFQQQFEEQEKKRNQASAQRLARRLVAESLNNLSEHRARREQRLSPRQNNFLQFLSNSNINDVGDSYEELLALDDSNGLVNTGATAQQINSLPKEKVTEQLIKNDEKCSICLEEFVIGNEIRRLPCLHVFDPDCIDHWLGKKKNCPICKTSIVQH